jgi:hypothetical protein
MRPTFPNGFKSSKLVEVRACSCLCFLIDPKHCGTFEFLTIIKEDQTTRIVPMVSRCELPNHVPDFGWQVLERGKASSIGWSCGTV